MILFFRNEKFLFFPVVFWTAYTVGGGGADSSGNNIMIRFYRNIYVSCFSLSVGEWGRREARNKYIDKK